MNINEVFPSNYLKADDMKGKDYLVIIKNVVMKELGQGKDAETKAVVYFEKTEKGLVLNKTNATTIAGFYGGETNGWIGKKITIGPRKTEFQGRAMMALRVSPKKPDDGGSSKNVGDIAFDDNDMSDKDVAF